MTYSSYKCELLINKQVLSNATCFAYRKSDKTYLVSNWHVFSGINSETGHHMHNSACSPSHIRVYFPHKQYLSLAIPVEFELGDPMDSNSWKWVEHKKGSAIDVGLLEIEVPDNINLITVDFHDQDKHSIMTVGADIFVCGFPIGIGLTDTGAIWKRGSIASEPFVGHQGLPRFLVDTATREGMSGAPVYLATNYVRANILTQPGDADFETPWRTSPHFTFVGIYSGRLGQDEFKAQLGLVWRNSIIDEIIDEANSPIY